MTQRNFQQLITYALLDFDDTFGLMKVVLLSARYGLMVSWDLRDLLDEVGGVTLDQMRVQLEQALCNQG